jgi:hypothetical protein
VDIQDREQEKNDALNRGIIVVSLYIAFQIISDVASLKIVQLGGFSIDAGTFIYPMTFTVRDLVHKALGKRIARTVVVLAGVLNLFMAAMFHLTAWLPEDPSWGHGAAFAVILGPVWRIVIASICAEIVSELLDTEIYDAWTRRVTRRHQWSRVLVSNAVSVPVDSLIFCWAAFGLTLPNPVVWSIFISNVLIKGAVTLVSLPGIYLVKGKSARAGHARV